MAKLTYDCEKCGEEVFFEDAAEHRIACEGFSEEDAGVLAEIIRDIREDDDDTFNL
ncbi:MAG: hypothetical protein HYT41_02440 [Candidatus Sungbacteria bacterium]|nr:hypothetical protein [Candidatus Sungbacteria bacterium]